MPENRYVVEVLCTGIGFAKTKHGADTLNGAQVAEEILRNNPSAWVNPSAPKQTRVRDSVMGTTYSRIFLDRPALS